MTDLLGIESEELQRGESRQWLHTGCKIQAVGWNFFFMAEEMNATFLGARGAEKMHNPLTGILEKVGDQDFNCLEVTAIVAKRFLAHSRHIQ